MENKDLKVKDKKNLLEALENIKESYDAFYIENKYSDTGTHEKEFALLNKSFQHHDKALRALAWIKRSYDCYYEKDLTQDNSNPFYYLEQEINAGGK